VENYDPLGAVGYWRAGQLRLSSWAASLRQVDELAWFARDDLRPFGLMCLRMGWRAVSRPWTRGSSAQPRAAGGPRYRPGRRAVPPPARTDVSADFHTLGERV
jgi:D-aspartate ligase